MPLQDKEKDACTFRFFRPERDLSVVFPSSHKSLIREMACKTILARFGLLIGHLYLLALLLAAGYYTHGLGPRYYWLLGLIAVAFLWAAATLRYQVWLAYKLLSGPVNGEPSYFGVWLGDDLKLWQERWADEVVSPSVRLSAAVQKAARILSSRRYHKDIDGLPRQHLDPHSLRVAQYESLYESIPSTTIRSCMSGNESCGSLPQFSSNDIETDIRRLFGAVAFHLHNSFKRVVIYRNKHRHYLTILVDLEPDRPGLEYKLRTTIELEGEGGQWSLYKMCHWTAVNFEGYYAVLGRERGNREHYKGDWHAYTLRGFNSLAFKRFLDSLITLFLPTNALAALANLFVFWPNDVYEERKYGKTSVSLSLNDMAFGEFAAFRELPRHEGKYSRRQPQCDGPGAEYANHIETLITTALTEVVDLSPGTNNPPNREDMLRF